MHQERQHVHLPWSVTVLHAAAAAAAATADDDDGEPLSIL